MTDAPEIIILQPCFTHGWEFPDRVKYETSIAIKYTRTDISQARVAELEDAFKSAMGALGDIHDGEPEWPDDDKKELAWCRNRAFTTIAALKAKP
jgi:hypothetical protein